MGKSFTFPCHILCKHLGWYCRKRKVCFNQLYCKKSKWVFTVCDCALAQVLSHSSMERFSCKSSLQDSSFFTDVSGEASTSSLYTLEVKPLHHHFFECWYTWNGQGLVCCVLIKSLSCKCLKNWLRAKSCSATISSKDTIDKVKDKYYCHCHDPGSTPHQKWKGQSWVINMRV